MLSFLARLIGVVAFVLGVAFIVRHYVFPTYSHRYRMTVAIEADGKVHTGSGVVEVRWNLHGPLAGLAYGNMNEKIEGRAALVDLGKYGVVMAVLRPHPFADAFSPRPFHGGKLAFAAIYGANYRVTPDFRRDRKKYDLKIVQVIQQRRGLFTLAETAYPSFIWLPEPKRRETAKPLLAKNMPTEIAPSVHLKSVVIEMTDAAFSNYLFEKLPWAKDAWRDEYENGTRQTPAEYKLFVTSMLGGDKWLLTSN